MDNNLTDSLRPDELLEIIVLNIQATWIQEKIYKIIQNHQIYVWITMAARFATANEEAVELFSPNMMRETADKDR